MALHFLYWNKILTNVVRLLQNTKIPQNQIGYLWLQSKDGLVLRLGT
jgi:hypothetical protein